MRFQALNGRKICLRVPFYPRGFAHVYRAPLSIYLHRFIRKTLD